MNAFIVKMGSQDGDVMTKLQIRRIIRPKHKCAMITTWRSLLHCRNLVLVLKNKLPHNFQRSKLYLTRLQGRRIVLKVTSRLKAYAEPFTEDERRCNCYIKLECRHFFIPYFFPI
jgi:hypothetical protein